MHFVSFDWPSLRSVENGGLSHWPSLSSVPFEASPREPRPDFPLMAKLFWAICNDLDQRPKQNERE